MPRHKGRGKLKEEIHDRDNSSRESRNKNHNPKPSPVLLSGAAKSADNGRLV
jgi:hypothetical protein